MASPVSPEADDNKRPNISPGQVKQLRENTGAPMMGCKQALSGAKGDLDQAVVLLRKKGISMAGKKASRVTREGSVASYIHAGGKIGVLGEVNCERAFVAPPDAFRNWCTTSRCTSRPAIRNSCARKMSRRRRMSAKRTSIAPRPRPPASHPRW